MTGRGSGCAAIFTIDEIPKNISKSIFDPLKQWIEQKRAQGEAL